MNIFRNKESKGSSVYFDYAASTPVDPRVVNVMEPYWNTHFANPGGHYKEGEVAKEAIERARHSCARLLSAKQHEIIFTGSGTESNNLAIFGLVRALERQGRALSSMHFITTPLEHPSVRDCLKELEERGARVSYMQVNEYGLVDPNELNQLICNDTVLISLMYVNNEIGVMLQIKELGRIIRRKKNDQHFPYFHTDASQAGLYVDINVDDLAVDLLTLDAQKVYGPKGVGLLYKRKGVPLHPIIVGGNQEFSLRPSTENVPLIVGFGLAYALACENRAAEVVRVSALRDYCMSELEKNFDDITLIGPQKDTLEHRIPNNVNVAFEHFEGEYVVIALSEKGYACGTRSACMANSGGVSYVVEALGKKALADKTLRISMGKSTTKDSIDGLIRALKEIEANFDNTSKS